MAKYEQFSIEFLNELFKLSLYKKDCCEIISQHLDYSYIPVDLKGYKQVLKAIVTSFRATNKLPTIGSISQNFQSNPDVLEALEGIQQAKLPDREGTLKTLENYIKRVKFQLLYVKIAELYNNGNQEEAITLQAEESQKISNFSIFSKISEVHEVFSGFHKRDEDRFQKSQTTTTHSTKVPFGIDLLDAITQGGSEPGEIDCFLGRSGSGKTKWLRWRGISAARRGYKVLHIQAEGTLDECLLGYDATWTAVLKKDLKAGNIPSEYFKKIDKAIRDIGLRGGSIEVHAFEQFETASMRDVRDLVIDFYKRHNCYPDLLILDYLELFDPGNRKHYSSSTEGEKFRREDSARAFKNICNEFGIRGATAAQANDISPTDFNRTDWVMTRHNVAGAKGLIDPFSYFFTFNVSKDEYSKNLARIYVDKMREYQAGQTIRICTNYNKDRFYDRPMTLKLFPEDYED